MKFKTIQPNEGQSKAIGNILMSKASVEVMAQNVIKLFPDQYTEYVNDFKYDKYIAATEDERLKYLFIPINLEYVAGGDDYDKRTIIFVLKKINNIILYKAIYKKKNIHAPE